MIRSKVLRAAPRVRAYRVWVKEAAKLTCGDGFVMGAKISRGHIFPLH